MSIRLFRILIVLLVLFFQVSCKKQTTEVAGTEEHGEHAHEEHSAGEHTHSGAPCS